MKTEKNIITKFNSVTSTIFIILFLIALSFISGFAYRHSKPSYLVSLKNKFEKIFVPNNNSLEEHTNSCPKKITKLPRNSILIIGHAYGSPRYSNLRGNKGISPKVYDFYSKNKQNIEAIIFSGDVLKEPSAKKWNNFYSEFKEDLKIYISPGNHDVGVNYDNARRDIFNMIVQKKQNQTKFPFKIEINGSIFIIADSNSEENPLEEIFSIIDKEAGEKDIYIVLHHVLTKGLSFAANSSDHIHLKNNLFFKSKLKVKNDNKIVFLYGDGGVDTLAPRFACLKISNSLHMVGGIGEIPGDTIFVISNNNLYRMEI